MQKYASEWFSSLKKLTKFSLLRIALLASIGVTNAWAGSVDYSYDNLGRVIKVTYSTGVVITYIYDAAGNRKSYVVVGAPN